MYDNLTEQAPKKSKGVLYLILAVTAVFVLSIMGIVIARNRPIATLEQEHEHDWNNWVIRLWPTCDQPTEYTRTCKTDSAHIETRKGTDPQGHDYGEWKLTVPATTTVEGVETRTCTREYCNYTETRPTPVHIHVWEEYGVAIEPTCTLAGVETRVCFENSAHTESRPVPALGHDYRLTETTAPTCTEVGTEVWTCAHDGGHIETYIFATAIGHNYIWTTPIEPLCESTGIKIEICQHDVSHTRGEETISALGHDWSAWIVTAPTESVDGRKIRTCQHDDSHIEEEWNGYATGSNSLLFTLINNNTEYEVYPLFATNGDVVIPAYYRPSPSSEYLPVTSIKDWSFIDCTNLTSITLPEGLTRIGDGAFLNCVSLATATIPSSVTYIGLMAFNNCMSLTTVTIPASVTFIGWSAFVGCAELTAIVVDENNQHYASEGGILYNKAKTELIQAPASISGSVTIPDSVTSIWEYAFYRCTGLTTVTIPLSVTSIGRCAFYGWTAEQTIYLQIPPNVTFEIGWDEGCNAHIVHQG